MCRIRRGPEAASPRPAAPGRIILYYIILYYIILYCMNSVVYVEALHRVHDPQLLVGLYYIILYYIFIIGRRKF